MGDARAREASALRQGNDSLIAPQAIESAQNGLVDPSARGRAEGELIRRIPDARVIKRSLVIAGHRTSVSLEDAFWRRLRAIAAERGLSLNSLAAMIDASRDGANLSSAIRVFVLEAEGAETVPPSRRTAAFVSISRAAWRRIDLRRARLRPGRGRRSRGAGPVGADLVALRRGGGREWRLCRLSRLHRPSPRRHCPLAPLSCSAFSSRGFCPPRLLAASASAAFCASSRERKRSACPFSRDCSTLPVLDFLLPSIHQPLALETPVEEGALADVGFHRGDAIGLARDRLRRERGGKGADVDLPLRRLQRIVDRQPPRSAAVPTRTSNRSPRR